MIMKRIASFAICSVIALGAAIPAAAYSGYLYDASGNEIGYSYSDGINYNYKPALGTELYDKNGNYVCHYTNDPYPDGLGSVSDGERLAVYDEDENLVAYLIGSTYNYYSNRPQNNEKYHDENGNRYVYSNGEFVQENNCIYDKTGNIVGYCMPRELVFLKEVDYNDLYDIDGKRFAQEDSEESVNISDDYDYTPEVPVIDSNVAVSMGAVTPKTSGFDYLSTDVHGSLFNGKYYSGTNAYFKDEAEIFTQSQYGALCEKIQEAVDKSGIGLAVFTGGNYRSDVQTENFTALANEEIFGKNPDVNAVFLYLDFEGKSSSYDFIDTYNDAHLYYPKGGFDNRIESILDDMYKYLPKSGHTIYREDIKSAVEIFCKDIQDYHDRGMVWESSYKNAEDGLFRHCVLGFVLKTPFPPYKFWGVFLIIGIVLGLMIGASKINSIRQKYKFRETQNASSYTSRNRISFNDARDVFLREHTTSYRVQSSSGGHHGGGHHSGGSHRSSSHGGGGRHR